MPVYNIIHEYYIFITGYNSGYNQRQDQQNNYRSYNTEGYQQANRNRYQPYPTNSYNRDRSEQNNRRPPGPHRDRYVPGRQQQQPQQQQQQNGYSSNRYNRR